MRVGRLVVRGVATVFLLMAAGSCSGTGIAPTGQGSPLDASPSWFPAGDPVAYPRDAFLVGVGACGASTPLAQRSTCALQQAVEQIVLGVRSTVTATRERRCTRQTAGGGGAPARVMTECDMTSSGTAAGSLDLADTAPMDQHCNARGECFALVVLSRQDVAQRMRRAWSARHEEVRTALDQAAASDPLAAIGALHRALRAAARQDDVADTILAVAGPENAPARGVGDVLAQTAKVTGTTAICFLSFAPGLPADVVFAGATRTLAEHGFSRLVTDPSCRNAPIVVSFSGKTTESRGTAELGGASERDPPPGMAITTIEASGELGIASGAMGTRQAERLFARGVAESGDRARLDLIREVARQADLTVGRWLLGGEHHAN